MNEALEDAYQEFKRVEHLFYVSLKYTRTVDMMRHMVDRLISTLECGFLSILEHAKEQGKLDTIPNNKPLQAKLVNEQYPNDPTLKEYIQMYFFFGKLRRAPYTTREEFRRHVTMISTLDNNEIFELNIDVLGEYYHKLKEFLRYVRELAEGPDE